MRRLETAASSAFGVNLTTRAIELAIEPVPTNPQRTDWVACDRATDGVVLIRPPTKGTMILLLAAPSSLRRSLFTGGFGFLVVIGWSRY